MGVILRSKNLSIDMSYGVFSRFREKVAYLSSHQFGEHYSTINEGLLLFDDERKKFFEDFDSKTVELIESGVVSLEVIDFCLQPDSKGKMKRKQVKVIYEVIKHYDDNLVYASRIDCAAFESIKAVFEDSIKNGGKVKWKCS